MKLIIPAEQLPPIVNNLDKQCVEVIITVLEAKEILFQKLNNTKQTQTSN